MAISDLGPGALLAGDSLEYRLGDVLAEGGEGVVHFVRGREDVVAKLYKEWEYGRDEKLRRMIELSSKRLRRVAAWPLSRLSDDQDQTVGFVMESLDRWQPLHAVYQIRSRLQHSPNRTWAYLLRMARNLATCVHHVHEAGFVIGDLNESNVLVGPDAMVKIIDADSFQLRTEDRLYPCKVGKPELLGPELQGRSLEGLERVPNHDLFALAALIYQALVFGRHPFAGRPVEDQDLSLEDSIANGWYVFTRRRRIPLDPPPHLTIDWLPPAVLDLFERAFDPNEPARPTAREWFATLKELEGDLYGCDVNGSHTYWKGNSRCPWCTLEERWSVILFRPAPLDPLSAADFDVDGVWTKIRTLAKPLAVEPPAPIDYRLLPTVSLSPVQAYVVRPLIRVGHAAFWFVYLAIVFASQATLLSFGVKILMVLLAIAVVVATLLAEALRRKVRRANEKLEHLSKEWAAKADPELFDLRLQELSSIRQALHSNVKRYEAARNARIRELHTKDLENYLRKYSIYAADVDAATVTKLRRLAEASIQSAADISADSLKLRNEDDKFARELLEWRAALVEQFWHSSTYSLPPHEERAILERIRREDVAMRRELLAAEAELAEFAKRLEENQTELLAQAAVYRKIVEQFGPLVAALEPRR